MRSLVFENTKEGKERWDLCYGALMLNPEGYAKETRRVARRLLEKFEQDAKAVGTEDSLIRYEMPDNEVVINLEEAEFSLLKTVFDNTKWARVSIIKADKCMEWLESIQESKPRKVDEANA